MMASRWCKLYKGTPAELALEDAVAAIGIPYRTQFPLFMFGARYFPDFLLPTIGLVIEVDDPSHNTAEKRALDEQRTEVMRQMYGWRVVRCTNEEATNNPTGTVRRLLLEAGVSLPNSRRLRDCLPEPRSCPKKDRSPAQSARREQKLEARLRRRQRKQGPPGRSASDT